LAAIRAHGETALVMAPKKGENHRGSPSNDHTEQRSQNHEHT